MVQHFHCEGKTRQLGRVTLPSAAGRSAKGSHKRVFPIHQDEKKRAALPAHTSIFPVMA
jgi:hypothetical protein